MTSVNVPDRMNELTDGTVRSVGAATGAEMVHIGNPGLDGAPAGSGAQTGRAGRSTGGSMTRIPREGLVVAIVGLLLGLALTTPAAAQFATYEDWTSVLIRSDRWQGGENFGGQESRREIGLDPIGNFKLKLRYRHEGSTGSNVGNGSSGMFLNATQPTTVTEIKADFRVSTLSMNTCAANNGGAITRARPARLLMARFNDGASSGAGDRTGDFFGAVQEVRDGSTADPAGVLKVEGFINRCSNASCSQSTGVAANTLATTVSVGQTHNLKLIWDSPNNQFLFELDNSGTPTALPYNPASNVQPAVVPFVSIGPFHSTANCTAGAVTIDSVAVVGTVKTNASAVIP